MLGSKRGENFMHNISKFQMITITVIALFIFCIGAIYSNTKDVVENKTGERIEDARIQESGELKTRNRAENQDKMELQSISDRLAALEQRAVQQPVQQRYNGNYGGDFNLRCKIQGIIEDGSIVYMSEDDAMQEAKANGRSLVMHCSY